MRRHMSLNRHAYMRHLAELRYAKAALQDSVYLLLPVQKYQYSRIWGCSAPADHADQFSERLMLLPHTYLTNDHRSPRGLVRFT
jgi:hypothetical protein